MGRITGRRRVSLALASLALATVGVATAGPASAAACCSLYGTGSYTDDWTDEVTLSTGGTNRGNVVGVWQAVMWADQWSGLCSTTVDGVFGSGTYNNTRYWQGGENLAEDGIVGSATWGKADNYLGASGSYVKYYGYSYQLYFHRGSTTGDGSYTWSWNNSPYRYTGYSDIVITRSTSC